MLSVQGIYDGKVLRFLEKIKIHSPKKVIVTFLEDIDDDISSEELHQIASEGGAFYFLENEEEDIYTDADLKVKY
jgi:hypothetical protein